MIVLVWDLGLGFGKRWEYSWKIINIVIVLVWEKKKMWIVEGLEMVMFGGDCGFGTHKV